MQYNFTKYAEYLILLLNQNVYDKLKKQATRSNTVKKLPNYTKKIINDFNVQLKISQSTFKIIPKDNFNDILDGYNGEIFDILIVLRNTLDFFVNELNKNNSIMENPLSFQNIIDQFQIIPNLASQHTSNLYMNESNLNMDPYFNMSKYKNNSNIHTNLQNQYIQMPNSNSFTNNQHLNPQFNSNMLKNNPQQKPALLIINQNLNNQPNMGNYNQNLKANQNDQLNDFDYYHYHSNNQSQDSFGPKQNDQTTLYHNIINNSSNPKNFNQIFDNGTIFEPNNSKRIKFVINFHFYFNLI